MSPSPGQSRFDVVIMGGGPAGSSLAARLARTGWRVGLFEREHFPREHIGESFASPVVPCLVETGALPAVLASDCWLRKSGGYYAWDRRAPSATFFRHRQWLRDGVHRWSLHVDRARFDAVLLAHAARCGAQVCEGRAIRRVTPERSGVCVHLEGGERVGCRLFVDASGRANRGSLQARRGWLSSYRNVAVWGHFSGGRPAQSLDGDWNIFREPDLSPIGCFARSDGWCWYIPIPKTIDGRRVLTHSIGFVTDPSRLKRGSGSLQDPDVFLETIRSVPLLADLVRNVRPLARRLRTATNYSMISETMCDLDRRTLSIGDACFFVDPLFSSGVSFAMLQAAAASHVIDATLCGDFDRDQLGELWNDYDLTWSTAATAFATHIDQWYAAIAHENPGSPYWHERASNRAFHDRLKSFDWLVDCDPGGDLLFVITRGTDDIREVAPDGPLTTALTRLASMEPHPDARLTLARGVTVKASLTLGSSVFGASDSRAPSAWAHAEYWNDPMAHRAAVAPLFSGPRPCWRFCREDGSGTQVRAFDGAHEGVLDLLAAGLTLEDLRLRCEPAEWNLLLRLLASGMLAEGAGEETGPRAERTAGLRPEGPMG